LFFAIVQENGCLQLLMKKIMNIFGKWVWMVPIILFAIGWLLAAMGPGSIPSLPVIAALAVPLAHETGYNPIMLMMIGDVATFSGRFTPITPEGILVTKLMNVQGFYNLLPSVLGNTFIGAAIISVITFLFYKGYAVKISDKALERKNTEPFSTEQFITLGSIIVMLDLVIFSKIDIGLAAFLVATVLILTGVGKQESAMKNVPWNTLLLVSGVGVLMNLVISTGGIKLLAGTMSSVMNAKTAAPLAGLMAGCMYSSTIGVVLPTLLPTIGQLVNNVPGADAAQIISTIGITSACTGFSPTSAVGAIIMGAYEGDQEYAKQKSADKLFLELTLWSTFCIFFFPALSFVGFFVFK